MSVVNGTPNVSSLRPLSASESNRSDIKAASLRKKQNKVNRHFGKLCLKGKGITSNATVQPDGMVDVSLHHDNDLTRVLTAALELQEQEFAEVTRTATRTAPDLDGFECVPRLNVVIQIVGSRGDVQPFVALGKVLSEPPYNHRVRLCTHPAFKEFVEENGLEFFSIGGDPEQLMAYMVKNPGLMPGMESLKAGEIGKRRQGVQESLELAWRSCVEPSPNDESDPMRLGRGGATGKTFIADAIIANPPSFAHIHCAEKLHIPLHLMFTMPWSPTQSFPHPLANIKASNVDKSVANFLSYSLMELMTWQGLGDIINNFRMKTLSLDPISALWAGGLISRLEVPWTYAWSTALIPKPPDWGPHISISGFFFLGLASNYKPPQDLMDFLDAGSPPIYIGFGSIVIDNPEETTKMIFEAVERAGVRCLLSKGWSKLGGTSPPEGVFLLDNCPHDWLFPRVSCVIHHGGAGTTAIGVALGKPTVVVPFFGDQPFWGSMISRAGAGPEPVPFNRMTSDSLTASIEFALKPETLAKARELAEQIQDEDGKVEGAKEFHRALPLKDMQCMVDPHRLAVWRVKHTGLRLSAFGARVLMKEGLLELKDLRRIKYKEWNLEEGPRGPASGAIASVVGTLTDIMMGVCHLSHQIVKTSAKELQHPHIHHLHRLPKEPEVLEPIDSIVRRPRRHSNPVRIESRTANDGTSGGINPPQILPVVEEAASGGRKRWLRSHNHLPAHLYSRRNISSVFPGQLYHRGGLGSSVLLERRRRASLSTAKYDAEHDASLRKDIKGMARDGGLLLKAVVTWPIDLTYNLASGFHNAPILFLGDDTVRKHVKIVGFKSGMYAMGREVVLGLWDGTTGLVTQPYNGAKNEGGIGFVKGIGKGFGGLLLKTQAAVWAIPGYSLRGVQKQMSSLRKSGTEEYIERSRGVQGVGEYNESTQEQRDAAIKRWHELPEKVRGKRK